MHFNRESSLFSSYRIEDLIFISIHEGQLRIKIKTNALFIANCRGRPNGDPNVIERNLLKKRIKF